MRPSSLYQIILIEDEFALDTLGHSLARENVVGADPQGLGLVLLKAC